MSTLAALTLGTRSSTSALVAVACCGSLFAPPLSAQDSLGGSIAVTSDYRVRGISQTRGQPAVQGGIHARIGTGWVAGAWASTIDRNRGSSATSELDAYAAYGFAVSPDWNAKVALTHYWYPSDPARTNYDYDELSTSITYRSQFIATVAWSPNTAYFGYSRGRWQAARSSALSYELTGLHPLTSTMSLTGGVGYNDLSRLFGVGYWYWNTGLSYSMGPVQLDVQRIDSDTRAQRLFGSKLTEAGWSAAISWRF